MRRKIWLVGLLVVLALILPGCGAKPIAEVNGEKLSAEEFNRYLEQTKAYAEQQGASFEGEAGKSLLAQAKQDTVERWTEETVIFQIGKKENIVVTEDEINSYLTDKIKTSFETEAKYQEWLTTQKMTEQDLLRLIRYQLTGQQLYEKITGKIQVTDAQAEASYQKNKSPWEKVKVSHILINAVAGTATEAELASAKAKAVELIKQLDQGANFADLAKKNSGDPGSAANGGVLDMEFTRQDTSLVAEFVAGAFQLKKVGDYSKEPVLSQFGYHILKLDSLKGSFAEVKEDVKNQLLSEEKNTTFQKYIDAFKAESKIVTNLPEDSAAE